MDSNDRQAIEQLFGKLAAVGRQSPPRDAEAEDFIRQQIGAQPEAPYYMAQTIVVQEQALEAAQVRIEELEAQAEQQSSRSSGGLLGGLFGSSRPPPRSGMVPRVGRPAAQAAATPAQPQRGGGFLAGAAQTAMGVAGGVLLANAIGGMLGGGGEAQAAEAQPEAGAEAAGEAPVDDGGFSGDGFGDLEF